MNITKQTSTVQPQSFALVASRERPFVRTLDIIFWACTFVSLGFFGVRFVAVHAFGRLPGVSVWTNLTMIDYWFFFSLLLGPLMLVTREPVGRFLSSIALPRNITFGLALLALCGLEELTGKWAAHLLFFRDWSFGTLVLVAWGTYTLAMMRLLKLSPKEALYLGGLAGWVQEGFLFEPRFIAAPVLTTILGPLIAFTYMQLILWPLGLYSHQPRENFPRKKLWLRYVGALVGVLALESGTSWALYHLMMRR